MYHDKGQLIYCFQNIHIHKDYKKYRKEMRTFSPHFYLKKSVPVP